MRDEQPHRLLRGARHDAADVLERRRTPEFARDARRAEGLERPALEGPFGDVVRRARLDRVVGEARLDRARGPSPRRALASFRLRVRVRAQRGGRRARNRGDQSPRATSLKRAIACVEAVILYTAAVLSIAFLFVVLIGLAGWIPLYLCWWGRLTPQAPCCAACGHASGDTPERLAARCAECGCDLDAPNALVYFKRARTPLMRAGIIVGAIVVTLCSLLPVASVSVFVFAVGRQGGILPTRKNNVVVPAVDSTASAGTPSDASEPSDKTATEQTPSESSAQEDVR
jgi:hypothetical protein